MTYCFNAQQNYDVTCKRQSAFVAVFVCKFWVQRFWTLVSERCAVLCIFGFCQVGMAQACKLRYAVSLVSLPLSTREIWAARRRQVYQSIHKCIERHEDQRRANRTSTLLTMSPHCSNASRTAWVSTRLATKSTQRPPVQYCTTVPDAAHYQLDMRKDLSL